MDAYETASETNESPTATEPDEGLSALYSSMDHLAALIEAGLVRPAKRQTRRVPQRRIKPAGSVSDLLAEQRR
jgi:hypothetical protein